MVSSQINNSMFCGKLGQHVDITKLIKQIENKYSLYTCSFVEEIFPALFVKPTKPRKKIGIPTTILFPNGSFIIMGATEVSKVKFAHRMLTSLVK